jgi:outer membrane lipoprotein-sorting protein
MAQKSDVKVQKSDVKVQKSDVKAQQILKGVSEKYRSYKSVQADFVLKVENGQNNSKDQQTGTLFMKG